MPENQMTFRRPFGVLNNVIFQAIFPGSSSAMKKMKKSAD
jgi:hypothetical protein